MNMKTTSYLLKVAFTTETDILNMANELKAKHGCRIRIRGRHSDRKKVLGWRWRTFSQNDIPWRMAEQVVFYKRDN